MQDREDRPDPRAWTGGVAWGGGWYGPARSRGTSTPWLGALLVLLGGAFLVHQLIPAVDAWGLLALALGALFALRWARGRSTLGLWVGALLLGYGVARLLLGLDLLVGSGWESVGVGLAFAVAWLVTVRRRTARTWPLAAAAVFILAGLGQLASALPALQGLNRYLAPGAVIALGALLMLAGMRRRPVHG